MSAVYRPASDYGVSPAEFLSGCFTVARLSRVLREALQGCPEGGRVVVDSLSGQSREFSRCQLADVLCGGLFDLMFSPADDIRVPLQAEALSDTVRVAVLAA